MAKYAKKRQHRQRLPLPGWIFAGIMMVYSELMLHLWTNRQIEFSRLGVVVLISLAVGTFVALLTSLFSAKVGKRVAVGVGIFAAVMCIVEYFIYEYFQTFMPLSMMKAGGTNVVTNFMAEIVDLIVHHIPHILAMLLPVIAYGVFCDAGKVNKVVRLSLTGAAVVVTLLAVLVVSLIPGYAAGLKSNYAFDNAVRSFGMYVSLPVDVYKSNALNNNAPSFEIDVTLPPETTAPAENQSGDGTGTEEATEPPIVYNDQVLGIDFAALAESETNSAIANMHAYVASQTPAKENEYTGLFKGKNLILITAEAFTGEFISPELTPTLYRMMTQGIHFTNYYQPVWGAGTTGGEFTNLIGLAPNSGECMKTVLNQNYFLTMGHQLQRLGYTSASFHNNDYTYYSRHLTHTYLGYDTFMGFGNGIEEGVTTQWPESDDEMFRFTIPQYIDKQPFSLYYMTVSGHSSYSEGANAMSKKHYDRVRDMRQYSYAARCYIAANLELEDSMTYLIEQLEAAGIADDTVIVIAADHYPYGLEYSDLNSLFGESTSSFTVRDRNQLIIWSGCLEGENIVVDDPVFSLDILPTLSNLFDVEYDSRLMVGRDVFSDADPLIFWYDFSWMTDKGYFDITSYRFRAFEGVEVPEGYADAILAQVRNKITYSRAVQQNSYFNYITPLVYPEDVETEDPTDATDGTDPTGEVPESTVESSAEPTADPTADPTGSSPSDPT